MSAAQVVIQTAFLGDLILSIPFLKRVRENLPGEKLIVICKKGLGDFLIQNQIVDEAIEIEKNDRASYKKALAVLGNFQISNLFCVHRSVRSQLFSAQINATCKIGFGSFLGFWIFDDMVDYEESWPDALRKFRLLEKLDPVIRQALADEDWSRLNEADENGKLPDVPPLFSFAPFANGGSTDSLLRAPSGSSSEFNLADRSEKRKKQVCLFPGSVWATKKWTLEGYADVAQAIAQSGFKVLLLGGPDEKSLCEEIKTKVPEVEVWAGKLSIAESIDVIAESELVIANDSAATHMAAFKNTPAVTIFGPTTLNLGFRPWTNQSRIVQTHLNCRPCGKHGHQKCPLGHHNCMKKITAEEVLAAANHLKN